MELKSLAVRFPSKNRFEQWNLADNSEYAEDVAYLRMCEVLDDRDYLLRKMDLEMRMNDIKIARAKS